MTLLKRQSPAPALALGREEIDLMRTATCILLALAVPLMIFAVWGMFTAAGRSRFDEMDGIYPLVAGVLGGLLLVSGGVTWFFIR